VVKLSLPALRERLDDLPLLVEHFMRRHAPAGRPFTITPAAMRALSRHRWPGNVRELENEVQRWVALSDGVVDVADLSPMVAPLSGGDLDPEDLRIRPRVEHVERELIERALAQTAGNQTRAAELLGLSRFGLQKKLRRMGIGDGE
jgi:DNA-binding NtrC family response regulator